ncbi:MAG: AraC family transcriptional regulator, partial [Bacteroidota bacterium]
FQRRKTYKRLVFWLFMGCILSVILFAVGDDDYNLLIEEANWFLFHETLISTLFFLFVRYYDPGKGEFDKRDLWYLLPYIVGVTIQSLLSSAHFENNLLLGVVATFAEFCLIGMLFYSIYEVLKQKKERWLLAFLVPFTLVYTLDEVSSFWLAPDQSIFSLDSYGVFLIAILLFYFVTYKLIIEPKDILLTVNTKYQQSNLVKAEAASIQKKLTALMVEEKRFIDPDLSVDRLAEELGISRQQLSEILNVHMGVRFQDLLNQYRVQEFITCLHEDRYQNYTLLGIATEVGFSSKSSFNATFKKLKGVTPSQYRKGIKQP